MRVLVAIVLSFCLIGCKSESSSSKTVLTVELLKKAPSLFVKDGDFDEIYGKVTGLLGKESVDDNESYIWALVEGDVCSYFYVNKGEKGKALGGRFGQDIKSKDADAYKECVDSSKGIKSE